MLPVTNTRIFVIKSQYSRVSGEIEAVRWSVRRRGRELSEFRQNDAFWRGILMGI